MSVQEDVKAAMIAAMRSKESDKLTTIRLITAAFKQIEVDERIELDDTRCLQVLDKMAKQRRESIAQFTDAGRDDLVAKEQAELAIIGQFLPEQLSSAEIEKLIAEAIAQTGASSAKDMGKVIGALRDKVQGRADMSQVSKMVKEAL